MAVSGTVFGAILGLGVQFYSNAVRKLPLMRNPWEHAIALGLGGFAGVLCPPPPPPPPRAPFTPHTPGILTLRLYRCCCNLLHIIRVSPSHMIQRTAACRECIRRSLARRLRGAHTAGS